ncbi:hypothetical protein BY458DRAFT_491595 [Sporodiniella umbellata]|nr:hypothetical protein BY458DRAFT_491595 [Sporodiniella umbellata]
MIKTLPRLTLDMIFPAQRKKSKTKGSFLSPLDISRLRNISAKAKLICDMPYFWRNIVLKIEGTDQMVLWNLHELKQILDPHLSYIETVCIRGVRDSIMQYIMFECPELKELVVCGWLSLSEHSFYIPPERKSPFTIKKLKLLGDSRQQSTFISLDSLTLGQWIGYCPYLEELSINCKAHFYAEDLVSSIRRVSPIALRSIAIATKTTWCSQHVTRLFQYCAQLQFLGLIPDSASLEYQNKKDLLELSLPKLLKAIVSNHTSQLTLLEKHTLPVEEEEMAIFHNIAIFSDF